MTQFPSVFRNILMDTNQNINQQQMNHQGFGQTMQTKPMESYNQQGNLYGSHQQQMQQAMNNPQTGGNPCPSSTYGQYNAQSGTNFSPQVALSTPGTGFLSQNVLDQIRPYATSATTPIFILPNGITCSNTFPTLPTTCIPYSLALPIFHSAGKESECNCSNNKTRNALNETYGKWQQNNTGNNRVEINTDFNTEHNCKEGSEGVVCSKKNCPLSIQLQAMVSQLLSIQGIISSTITRILLKHIPGSNINESVEEIMERAARYLRQMSKEELLKESKSSQQINGLLGLYLTSLSTQTRIIPIITSAQLKNNVLKAQVESLVNARLMEDQGCGVQAPEALDTLLLQLKSDSELRQLLNLLREKECEERINLNFAAYASQRLIAGSRLTNVQSKIRQIENEMERRRNDTMTRESQLKRSEAYNIEASRLIHQNITIDCARQDFESPNCFANFSNPSPKKLLLKPHVGSPETTYNKSNDSSSISECGIQNDENKLSA